MSKPNKTIKKFEVNKSKTNSTYKKKNGSFRKKDDLQETDLPQDWQWYASDKTALDNIASIPFSTRLGDIIPAGAVGDNKVQIAFPGLMRMTFLPTVGVSENAGSDINKATLAFFNKVTQGFSSYNNIQPSDYMLTMLAAESLFMLMIEGKRAYGLANHYSMWNRYFGKTLLEKGLGFDWDDLIANKANFRSRFNNYVRQINSAIKIPKGFSIGDRWEILVSGVFCDSNDKEKCQMYCFKPGRYMQLNETQMLTGTAINYYPNVNDFNSILTVEDYFARIDALFSKFLNNQDIANIFGTIARVYGEAEIKTLSTIDADELPVFLNYHKSIADMVHNAHIIPEVKFLHRNAFDSLRNENLDSLALIDDDSIVLYQDTSGAILTQPVWNPESSQSDNDLGTMPMTWDNQFIDFDDEGRVAPEVVIDGLTWCVPCDTKIVSQYYVGKGAGEAKYGYKLYPRCDILTEVAIITLQDPDAVSVITDAYPVSISSMNLDKWIVTTNFHRAPLAYRFGAMSANFRAVVLGHVYNYTTISKEAVIRMNERSFYTLLDVPNNSKSVTK